MTNSIRRYLVENSGPDESKLTTALQDALGICQRDGISTITLVMETKQSFQGSVLAKVLGSAVSKKVAAGQTVSLTGSTIRLDGAKTFSPRAPHGMVIGVYVGRGGMDALDSIVSAQAIVLVPWLEDEGKRWMSTWNPTVLGKSTWSAPVIDVSPDAEKALEQLTKTINLSTGLSHPSDKDLAKRTFANLKNARQVPNPAEVRKWALRKGWEPRHADDLKKLAARYYR